MQSAHNNRLAVSVIIPTYNRAGFVSTAIESALCQTYLPREILVIDDGSTDETPKILSQYAPPVHVIRQANHGRSVARNAGLRAATGDAVIFLDSDDRLLPRCVERCVQTLLEHPQVGVVYTDAYLCDATGHRVGRHSVHLPGQRPSGMVLGALARRNFLLITSLIRRSCLGGITFEDGMDCAEDYDFWRRMAARCPFQYVDEPLMSYHFHEAMTVETRAAEARAAEVEVQRRILHMREFGDLPGADRARAHCSHGAKLAVLGRTGAARREFVRAIRTSPAYHGGYALFGLSLLGTRVLQSAIHRRRELAGNRLGTRPAARPIPQHHRPLEEPSATIASAGHYPTT
jgi:glycosyltransferase involved in cell wall biosynthesis